MTVETPSLHVVGHFPITVSGSLLNKIDIESCYYQSRAPFFNEHEWVGLHINQSGSLLNKIHIESCYVFEEDWHWVLLCLWIRLTLSLVMSLNKFDIESFYRFCIVYNKDRSTLSTTTFFGYNILYTYSFLAFLKNHCLDYPFILLTPKTIPKWDSNIDLILQNDFQIESTLSHIQPKWDSNIDLILQKSFHSACLMLQSTKKWAIRMRK